MSEPSGGPWDVVVIGAGAAGLFCAALAGQRGLKVLLLEHMAEPGKKILISGGGRCNFTNVHTVPERFVSANPHFARSALARYTPQDFVALVNKHRIPWYEKTLGQLFCDGAGSAKKIVQLLLDEAAAGGVQVRLNTAVTGVSKADTFTVETSIGPEAARAVVVASGGLSIPKIGATGLAYDIASRFGMPLAQTRPGLVPLTFGAEALADMAPFSGASLDAVARADGPAFREAMLFTHRGLSGPSILQASSYWHPGQPLRLDLAPDRPGAAWLTEAKRTRPRQALAPVLAEVMPGRFADHVVGKLLPHALARPLADLKDRELEGLAATLHDWQVWPTGTEGYLKAEVTVGGIDTNALSSRTMAAKAVPGLYFIGEAVDVTGWLGGYNFQWAWASAHAAAAALTGE
jgi:predicted Rossmann fold flavoprotein